MGALAFAIHELAGDDLDRANDDELEASLHEIERASAALEVERARRVREVSRRGAFRHDGFLSTTSWLASKLRIGGGTAARNVRWSRALDRAPSTRRAMAAGDITLSAASTLLQAAESHPAAFERDEALLVAAVRSLSGREFPSHHRAVHDRFSVALDAGRPMSRRNAGAALADRAPP